MLLTVKCGTEFEAANLVEQRVTRSDEGAGWILTFVITTPMTSAQIDEILSDKNISEIHIAWSEADEAAAPIIVGYEKVDHVTIRYDETGKGMANVQLSKKS